jgi:hypothetical protein
MFTKRDLQFIKSRGSIVSDVENQIKNFIKGFPFLPLRGSATTTFGIIGLNEKDIERLINRFDKAVDNGLDILKFIPASGAASRMFNDLFSFRDEANNNVTAKKLIELPEHKNVKQFFERLTDFAFYDELVTCAGEIKDENGNTDYCKIIDCLLTRDGLNYSFLPKGLIKFHSNNSTICTPVREHMVEGTQYSTGSTGKVNLHFTVSNEHKSHFKNEVNRIVGEIEKEFKVNFEISFSEQKPSTDTIAVDSENNPFRLDDGTILFRPGGHGALLDNLNDILSDIIFIKNIDNVVPDTLKETTSRYKKALAGLLLMYREKIFNYLEQLEEAIDKISNNLLDEIAGFLENDICIKPSVSVDKLDKKALVRYLQSKLNRPIRVCGMVKNEGEPGGGPFIAENTDGTLSLQIAEESQVDKFSTSQVNIFKSSTHFNPVDLICGVKDFRGDKFDLSKFRDPKTGFISEKSKDGRMLKAQELPGLWNGAMSDWNTLFVEVPVITFNPVKIVNDLLRIEHQ